MAKPTVTVRLTGPMFNGQAQQAAAQMMAEAADEVARIGEADVQVKLRSVLRNPTGRYQGSIVVERQANDRVIYGDRLVYGPWLEGVGSRNKTTRFKGYATFRLVAQTLQGKVAGIVQPIVVAHLREMQ